MRGDGDVAGAVKAIVPGGADYAFEAIGLQRTIELMPDLLCLGGVAVMVGMTAEDVRVSFSGFGMAEFGHSVLGSNYGPRSRRSTSRASQRCTRPASCRSTG